MQDKTKIPSLQQPVMCDFGEFAGGLCGNPIVLSYKKTLVAPDLVFTSSVSNITINDIMAEIEKVIPEDFEKIDKTKFNIGNNDGKVSIGFPKVIFTSETKITKEYLYGIEDLEGNKLVASITFIIQNDEYTPVAPVANNKTISFEDNLSKTINIKNYFTVDSKAQLDMSTMDIIVTDNATNETINVDNSNGTIIISPDESLTTTRTFTITYQCSDTNGLQSNIGTLIVTVQDFNPYAASVWYGSATAETIDQLDIEADLTQKSAQDFPGTYTFGLVPFSYKWMVYPRAWGEPNDWKDAVTNMGVPREVTPQYIEKNGVQLIGIRTFYSVSGEITIKVT